MACNLFIKGPRKNRVVVFGAPIVGAAYLLFFIQFYLLKFATDVLLLPAAAVGAIFGLGKLWDAVSDPLVGTLSDRTRSRLGRRRRLRRLRFVLGIPVAIVAGL